MKKTFNIIAIMFVITTASFAQSEKGKKAEKNEKDGNGKLTVPEAVKSAHFQKSILRQ